MTFCVTVTTTSGPGAGEIRRLANYCGLPRFGRSALCCIFRVPCSLPAWGRSPPRITTARGMAKISARRYVTRLVVADQ